MVVGCLLVAACWLLAVGWLAGWLPGKASRVWSVANSS